MYRFLVIFHLKSRLIHNIANFKAYVATILTALPWDFVVFFNGTLESGIASDSLKVGSF